MVIREFVSKCITTSAKCLFSIRNCFLEKISKLRLKANSMLSISRYPKYNLNGRRYQTQAAIMIFKCNQIHDMFEEHTEPLGQGRLAQMVEPPLCVQSPLQTCVQILAQDGQFWHLIHDLHADGTRHILEKGSCCSICAKLFL